MEGTPEQTGSTTERASCVNGGAHPVLAEVLSAGDAITPDFDASPGRYRRGEAKLYVNNILNTEHLELSEVETHQIVMEVQAFASGGIRTCHYVWFGDGKGPMKVAKRYIHNETFAEDYLGSHITYRCAQKFNEAIEGHVVPPVKLRVVVPHCVLHFEGSNYWIEPYLQGEWVKHNDIFGSIYTTSILADAFSHFSFLFSEQKYIILDIQGVGLHWSDPAVVSYDRQLGGITDTGEDGIVNFFRQHTCNALCAALGLPQGEPPAPRPPRSEVAAQADSDGCTIEARAHAVIGRELAKLGIGLSKAPTQTELLGIICKLLHSKQTPSEQQQQQASLPNGHHNQEEEEKEKGKTRVEEETTINPSQVGQGGEGDGEQPAEGQQSYAVMGTPVTF